MKSPLLKNMDFYGFCFDIQELTTIDFSERSWKSSVERTIPGMHIVKKIVNHSNFWYWPETKKIATKEPNKPAWRLSAVRSKKGSPARKANTRNRPRVRRLLTRIPKKTKRAGSPCSAPISM